MRKIGLRNLVVNSLGEVANAGKCVVSSVNEHELRRQLGMKPTSKDYSAEFNRQIDKALTPRAAARVKAVWRLQEQNDGRFRAWMAAEFNRQIDEVLTPRAAARVKAVWRLQEQNDGRFRVWMARGGKVYLSTEFCELVADKAFWQRVRHVVRQYHLRMWVMREEKRNDQWSKDGGKTWLTGPGHVEMERQVSLDAQLDTLSLYELREVRNNMKRGTKRLWEKAGVNVI